MYMVNLLDFINFISQTDDIHDVALRVGEKVTSAGGGRPLPPPLATGLTSEYLLEVRTDCQLSMLVYFFVFVLQVIDGVRKVT